MKFLLGVRNIATNEWQGSEKRMKKIKKLVKSFLDPNLASQYSYSAELRPPKVIRP